MQTTIWHNPRCSKSRTTLQLIESKGVKPNIVLYLTNPPSAEELSNALKCLNMEVREIIRKGEAAYSENNLADQTLSTKKIIDILVKNPILIERPIVIKGDEAVIGRPPENILNLI